MRTMADIEAEEYPLLLSGNAFFQLDSAIARIETLRCLAQRMGGWVSGWERQGYHTPAEAGFGSKKITAATPCGKMEAQSIPNAPPPGLNIPHS